MSILGNDLLLGSGDEGYNLTRSLRFRSSASAYLNRTFTSTGNRTTWTWSGWVKRGALSSGALFGADGSNYMFMYFSPDSLDCGEVVGSQQWRRITSQVFRDPSAWYHIVLAFDSTQATAGNRVKLYVNGSQVTAFSTSVDPSLNYSSVVNTTIGHSIGSFAAPTRQAYLDGYLTEVNFIDGQALTPSSFGETDTATGVWKPKRYAGTYGTNGFYLPFTDNSALTTSSNVGLGKDFSGNGNYWTTNNISITAGTTYDSMTDVPTLTSATASNFCTLNPLDNLAAVPSGGNLNQGVSNPYTRCNSTIFVSSGKWYFEVTLNTAGTNTSVGIGQNNNNVNQYPGYDAKSFVQEIDNARKGTNDTYTAYGTALTAGQVFMCAIDLDNLKLFFGGQGTWFASSDPVAGTNPAFTLTAGLYCAISRPYGGSAAISINFGQRPFAYTPPTGYVALNTYNLPTSTIVKGNTVMDATLFTGAGAAQSIVNAGGFKPDLVWEKNRSNINSWLLYTSSLGVGKYLQTDTSGAEGTLASSLTSFDATGFSLGNAGGAVNATSNLFVAYQWQAGQGTTSSNTNGTITSTVSVNASAGFSVVTYTGTGVAATVGHGLGVAPSMVIVKQRNATQDWMVGSSALTSWNQYLILNAVQQAAGSTTVWNDTAPTSSVFSLGNSATTNGNTNTYVAYCWAPISGYSSIGKYTGNGVAAGTFVYTGFQPKFILIKSSSTTYAWFMEDSARNVYNGISSILQANSSAAEITGTTYNIDFLSNGFKLATPQGNINGSGDIFIYMAFAENPFKNALAR